MRTPKMSYMRVRARDVKEGYVIAWAEQGEYDLHSFCKRVSNVAHSGDRVTLYFDDGHSRVVYENFLFGLGGAG